VSDLSDAAKRLLLGRPVRSDRLGHTLLPKRIALPVFASDAMSSVAYAPQEIFATLSVAGLAAYAYAPWIAILVCVVMLVVVASYRQNVHAYPSGGGDYEVATTNLRAGYLRKNGVPYSAGTTVNEYYDYHKERNGDEWFTVTTIVRDPKYLTGPWITSSDFKKEPDGSKWDPSPCTSR